MGGATYVSGPIGHRLLMNTPKRLSQCPIAVFLVIPIEYVAPKSRTLEPFRYVAPDVREGRPYSPVQITGELWV
jgi:hypothetical protein